MSDAMNNVPLVLAAFLVLGGLVISCGFALGWWLASRVADRIDDEKHEVAQEVARVITNRVLKQGPN